jgi:hypothetical protein
MNSVADWQKRVLESGWTCDWCRAQYVGVEPASWHLELFSNVKNCYHISLFDCICAKCIELAEADLQAIVEAYRAAGEPYGRTWSGLERWCIEGIS